MNNPVTCIKSDQEPRLESERGQSSEPIHIEKIIGRGGKFRGVALPMRRCVAPHRRPRIPLDISTRKSSVRDRLRRSC